MTQLDDDTLGKLVTAKILKKDSNSGGSTPQDPDALQDQITDAIENGETADQIIARLEPTWTTHLNRCNGLSEANKKEILEAMKNLVRNDLLAQRYDINIEDGWFNILGNINPVT
jgi:hypothetical protein